MSKELKTIGQVLFPILTFENLHWPSTKGGHDDVLITILIFLAMFFFGGSFLMVQELKRNCEDVSRMDVMKPKMLIAFVTFFLVLLMGHEAIVFWVSLFFGLSGFVVGYFFPTLHPSLRYVAFFAEAFLAMVLLITLSFHPCLSTSRSTSNSNNAAPGSQNGDDLSDWQRGPTRIEEVELTSLKKN